MADNQEGKGASEPTMEEILASIRKIIADEKAPDAPAEAAKPETEDVLELTQMVQDDGSIVDLSTSQQATIPAAPPASPSPAPEPNKSTPAAAPPSTPAPAAAPSPPQPSAGDSLVSDKTAVSATSSLASLASTVQIERMAAHVPQTPLGSGVRTLEDMVADLIKPMLKEWLDQNLPGIVEKLVQKEIERIAKHVQD